MSYLSRWARRAAPNLIPSTPLRPKGLPPSVARAETLEEEPPVQAKPLTSSLHREVKPADEDEGMQAKPLLNRAPAEEETSEPEAQALHRAPIDEPQDAPQEEAVQAKPYAAPRLTREAAQSPEEPAEETAQPLSRVLHRAADPVPEDTEKPQAQALHRAAADPVSEEPTDDAVQAKPRLHRALPVGMEEVTPETTPQPEFAVGEEPGPEVQAKALPTAHPFSRPTPAAKPAHPTIADVRGLTPLTPSAKTLPPESPATGASDRPRVEGAQSPPPYRPQDSFTPWQEADSFASNLAETTHYTPQPASQPTEVTIEQVDVIIHDDGSRPAPSASASSHPRQDQRFRAQFLGGL
ncbi:hypothetical protein [Woodsholea maritima]|uniref:hypothetical protein n=1 Tax=Woodsholea maritima TaxID=240237 RepID=UPI0003612177|nr:hypothetical protein [Woodsholea maritima]